MGTLVIEKTAEATCVQKSSTGELLSSQRSVMEYHFQTAFFGDFKNFLRVYSRTLAASCGFFICFHQ